MTRLALRGPRVKNRIAERLYYFLKNINNKVAPRSYIIYWKVKDKRGLAWKIIPPFGYTIFKKILKTMYSRTAILFF